MSRSRGRRVARLLRLAGRGDADARRRLRRTWAEADLLDLDREPARLRGRPPRSEEPGGEGER
ncbi:MAG: hypothetical protein ACQEXJ_05330 [Myxococcota bacterium]